MMEEEPELFGPVDQYVDEGQIQPFLMKNTKYGQNK